MEKKDLVIGQVFRRTEDKRLFKIVSLSPQKNKIQLSDKGFLVNVTNLFMTTKVFFENFATDKVYQTKFDDTISCAGCTFQAPYCLAETHLDCATNSFIVEDYEPPKGKQYMSRALVEKTLSNGGLTFNFSNDAYLSGQPYYAVAMYSSKEKVIPLEDFNEAVLFDYIFNNYVLLKDRRNSLGTWIDTTENKVYLDISRTISDLETAKRVGRELNQIAIFDLKNLKEIKL